MVIVPLSISTASQSGALTSPQEKGSTHIERRGLPARTSLNFQKVGGISKREISAVSKLVLAFGRGGSSGRQIGTKAIFGPGISRPPCFVGLFICSLIGRFRSLQYYLDASSGGGRRVGQLRGAIPPPRSRGLDNRRKTGFRGSCVTWRRPMARIYNGRTTRCEWVG